MKRLASKHLVWAGLGGIALWILGTAAAWADPIVVPSGQVAAPPDVATLLTPMLAAATGIERLLETAWNFIENAGRQVIAELGLGKAWAAYARAQVVAAEQAFTNAINANPVSADDPLNKTMQKAEKDLLNAQLHLRDALASEQYKSLKQVVSLIVGAVVGIAISLTAKLDMFQLLHIYSDAGLFGEVVTGIVIGAGSGPVHSLIGILQDAKDAVDQTANLFNKRAAAQVVEHADQIAPTAGGATTPAPLEEAAPRALIVGLDDQAPPSADGTAMQHMVEGPAPTAADAVILSRLARR